MVNRMIGLPGVKIGHAQDTDARTGCTVILPEAEALAGVDVRGSAPGTREIECIKPVRLVEKIHGLVLSGGSAFGLSAASGVQRWLEERQHGFDVGVARVPIVPAAVIFDLAVGDPNARPDENMGIQACENAQSESPSGRIGAGCGATTGKLFGLENALQGGLGLRSVTLKSGVTLGALTVVNALGYIINPENEMILPHAPLPGLAYRHDIIEQMSGHSSVASFGEHTTLTVVVTDALLNREQATKVAQMAHDGMARVLCPSHTMMDGDIAFVLSTGNKECDLNLVGTLAAEMVAKSILDAASKTLTSSRLC